MMSIQHQLADGSWIDTPPDFLERMLAGVLDREPWLAPRLGRQPLTTREDALAFLAAGGELSHADYWHTKLRAAPAPRPVPSPPEMVRCDCGHECPAGMMMAASTGSACPACYDRMSE